MNKPRTQFHKDHEKWLKVPKPERNAALELLVIHLTLGLIKRYRY